MRQFSRTDPEYGHLIASTSKAVVVLDTDLNFEDCNEAAGALFRCARASMPARRAADFLPATQLGGHDSVAAMHQAARAALADLPQTMLSQLLTADGTPFDAIVQFEGVRLDGDLRIVARIRNISRLREAEQALSDSEERLRQVLENTSAVVFIKDPEGKYLFVNRRFCEMFGRTQEELHGAHDVDLFPPQVAAQLRADDRRVFHLRAAQEIEEALIVKGQPCTYMAIKFPLLNGAGDPYALCGIATDITNRKRSEAALRSAALAVSTAEGDALFEELTRYLAETLGVECAFIARCITPENDRVRTLSVYADGSFEPAMEYGLPGTVCGTVVGQEFRFIPEGVQQVYAQDPIFVRLGIQGYAAYPLNDSAGQPLGLIAIMSRHPLSDRGLIESMLKIFSARASAEIERQRSEEARRVSEASYQAIFEAAEDAIFVHDWDSGALVDVNPKACAVYGYSAEELKRLTVADVSSNVHPYTQAEALRRIEEAKAGTPVRFEWQRKNRDGSLHWDEMCLKPAVIAGRRRVLGFAREITERKRAEDALRNAALAVSAVEGDKVYEDLARQLSVTLDLDLTFIAVFADEARATLRALSFWCDGRPIPNLTYAVKNTPCETVVGSEFRAYVERVRERFPADLSWPFAAESYAAFPLFDRDGNSLGVIGTVDREPLRDVALVESVLKIFAARAVAEIERGSAAEQLRASEEQYRAIFAASVDGMVVLDAEASIVDANPAFLSMLEYRREQLVGAHPSDVLEPESPEICNELALTVMTGSPFHQECRARKANGELLDIEVRGAQMHYHGKPHLLAIVRDITARKRAEAERAQLEAQLRQAQKMEAIGHLTGGIAHDFNNILTSIMGYLVLATERQVDIGDAKLGKYLDQAQLSASRARDLIRQMLTFSRGQRGERKPVALAGLIRESVKLLRSTLPSTVTLRTVLDEDVPAALIDGVQMDQVLMNLCINARDAMHGAGTIRLSLQLVDDVEHDCASCRKRVRARRMLELAVQDTGSGIAPEVLERMFDPFFTTKAVGQGSGMGLATVHGIVHEHGGHVMVDTAAGRGTTFRILLPPVAQVATETSAPAAPSIARASRDRLSGRVLLVDDEPLVRQFMSELLTGWGLEVSAHENAVPAREDIERDPGRYDLVITDQTMPGMTGLELACWLVELRPGLPIVLYTGYGDNLQNANLERCGVQAVLPKPVDAAALRELVVRMLAPAAEAAR